MTKPKTDSKPEGFVPKGTLYAVAAVCVALGFFGGIVFSALKSIPNPPAPDSGMPRQTETPATASGPSEEQMTRIKALEEATSKNPDKAATWADLGNAYFDASQPEKAIQAYEKSLALIPNDADIITDMGVMYRRMGKPDKAIEAFERAMAVNPRHEISRYNKGIVLLHDLNNVEEAIHAWEDLARVNPAYMTPTGQSVKQMVEVFKSRREKESGKGEKSKS